MAEKTRSFAIAVGLALLTPILIHHVGHTLVKQPEKPSIVPFIEQPPAASLKEHDPVRYQQEVTHFVEARKAYENRLYAYEDSLKKYHRHALYIEAILAILMLIGGLIIPFSMLGAGLIASAVLTILAGHYMAPWYPLSDTFGFLVIMVMILLLLASPFIRIKSWLRD